MLTQYPLMIETPGRGFTDITEEIKKRVAISLIATGMCHIFLQHTSASLILCENEDPLVRSDLASFMQRLIPDGDPLCQHLSEGPDDMPSHIRTILTQSFLLIPITDSQLALGTWQGIYLWEHRLIKHERNLTITLMGE